jgi:hypothetical protein
MQKIKKRENMSYPSSPRLSTNTGIEESKGGEVPYRPRTEKPLSLLASGEVLEQVKADWSLIVKTARDVHAAVDKKQKDQAHVFSESLKRKLCRLMNFSGKSKENKEETLNAVLHTIQNGEIAPLVAYQLLSQILVGSRGFETLQERLQDKIKFLTPASRAELRGGDQIPRSMAKYKGKHPHKEVPTPLPASAQDRTKRLAEAQTKHQADLQASSEAKIAKQAVGSRLADLQALPEDQQSPTVKQKIAFLTLAQGFYHSCSLYRFATPEIQRNDEAFKKVGKPIRNFFVALISCLTFGLVSNKSGTEQIFDEMESFKQKHALAFGPNASGAPGPAVREASFEEGNSPNPPAVRETRRGSITQMLGND